MTHHTTADFWACYEQLPEFIQRVADDNYELLRADSRHPAKGHAIGTGLIEATVKQPVAQRLKGCGMHWSRDGATAITALRAQDLNGHWHQFWRDLTLTA